MTDVGAIALAVSPSGKIVVTVNRGSGRASLTVMQNEKSWETRQVPVAELTSVAAGLAFSSEHSVFVSEGNPGRVSLVDLDSEAQRRVINLEPGSVTGDLTFDPPRNALYIADLAHSRIVVVDTRTRQPMATIELEGVPVALALGPDRRRLYAALAPNLLKPGSTADVCTIDVGVPRTPRVERTTPLDGKPAGILATARQVFISDTAHDSIRVLDAGTAKFITEISIRIPQLEAMRGVSPIGMALEERTGWLLVAEAGINAVGVIDAGLGKVLGHIPAGWRPTSVAVRGGKVYVVNGRGTGASSSSRGSPPPRGSVSMFAMPEATELATLTRSVLEADGFASRQVPVAALPAAIRHVALIVKDGRSFDEVLGDLKGTATGAPPLARFGHDGYVDGRQQRLSLHHLDVTPNHRAIAERWTFSDNFYADAEGSDEGVHRLAAWSELARRGVAVYRFQAPFDAKTSDTERVRRVIEEIQSKFASGGAELPGLLVIELPNDRMAAPDPASGFAYAESFVADNDLALGRLMEYFSGTKWWSQMAVFVTEASAEGGVDHIDPHRTVLLCAGPWARNHSVAHANADFGALRKTILRLLRAPPASLSDAAAADLSECFAKTPDAAPYRALPEDPRLYQP